MSESIFDPEDDDDFLAAELALGLAQGERAVAGRARIQRDFAFAAKVAGWQERFVAMTDDIPEVSPGRRFKKRLFAQVFPKARRPLMQRLWVWQGISFAALAMVAYLAFPLLRPETPEAPSDLFATRMVGDVDALEVLAVVDPARADVALHRVAGDAPQGRVLELWAILPDTPPISLGVLPADEKARVPLPQALLDQVASITLAISDEPPGGAPQGTPTGSIRAVGSLTDL